MDAAQILTYRFFFLVHEYDPDTNTYTPKGRTGLLKATRVLLQKVEITVNAESKTVTLHNHTLIPDGYSPFHTDLDIQAQLASPSLEKQGKDNDNDDDNDADDDDEESDDEPYIVEKVVSKRFRANQYEFLVKWKGYTDNENTWELPDNIPDEKLDQFEASHGNLRGEVQTPTERPRRNIRKASKPGFIHTF